MPNIDLNAQQEAAKKQPVFINNLNVPILVHDQNRRQIQVMPFAYKGRHPNGVYEVYGEHYRQFTSPYGSLSPFRPENHPPEAANVVQRGVREDVQRAVREEQQKPPEPPKAMETIPPVTAHRETAPTHIGTPEEHVLDSLTAYRIQRAAPNATPQERSDLATFVLKRRTGADVKLHSSLVTYEHKMEQIADNIDPVELHATPEKAPPALVMADGRLDLRDGETKAVSADADPAKQGDAMAASATRAQGAKPDVEKRKDDAKAKK